MRPGAGRAARWTLALALAGGLGGRAAAEEKGSLPGIEQEFKAAIKRVTPATVVCLAVDAHSVQDGSSGAIVSKQGLVLSDGDASLVMKEVGAGNARRLERSHHATEVKVRVPDVKRGFKEYDAKVVRRVEAADSTLLRIVDPPPGGFATWLVMGSSDDLEVGDFTFAMGNSFGLATEALPSLTAGVVAGLTPYPQGHPEGRWEALYTSAAINPGVNGGPLVDVEGRFVGTISNYLLPLPQEPYQFLGKVIPVQRLRRLYGDLPEAAEMFPEAKPGKAVSAQAAALETTFHAAALAGYPAVASLVVEHAQPWKRIQVVPQNPRQEVPRFEGPVSAVVVSARGECVTSLYNLTNTYTLADPPGVGEVVPPELALGTALGTITKITVCLPDGRAYPGRLVGTNPRLGIALVRAEIPGGDAAAPVPTAAPPDTLREGRFALALGNPFGAKPAPWPLLTVGILSKLHAADAPVPWRGDWQTDAGVTDANCGGALVSLKGEIYGMLQIWDLREHARYSGLGFVVPWSVVLEALDDLRAGKVWTRGFLGFTPKPNDSPMVLDAVVADGPAARAGLKAGDRVVAIDGRPMRDAFECLKALRFRWAGERVRFTIERIGEKKPLEIDTVLAPRPEPSAAPTATAPPATPPAPPDEKPPEPPPAPEPPHPPFTPPQPPGPSK